MPNWIVDEDKWEKAKEIAGKQGHEGDYAFIVGVYKQMTGRIKGKVKKSSSLRLFSLAKAFLGIGDTVPDNMEQNVDGELVIGPPFNMRDELSNDECPGIGQDFWKKWGLEDQPSDSDRRCSVLADQSDGPLPVFPIMVVSIAEDFAKAMEQLSLFDLPGMSEHQKHAEMRQVKGSVKHSKTGKIFQVKAHEAKKMVADPEKKTTEENKYDPEKVHLGQQEHRGVGDMKELYNKLKVYPTSENGDKALIRSHIAYHTGVKAADEAEITPSRGSSYRIKHLGRNQVVKITDPYDHREGVSGWTTKNDLSDTESRAALVRDQIAQNAYSDKEEKSDDKKSILWNSISTEKRIELLKQARFITNKNELSGTGRKASGSKWDDLSPAMQSILSRTKLAEAKKEASGSERHAIPKDMASRIVVGDRPQSIPDDWLIFNASRPLVGDKTWDGDFVHGRHYAAIDPNGKYADRNIEQNRKLDGWALNYKSHDDAVKHAESVITGDNQDMAKRYKKFKEEHGKERYDNAILEAHGNYWRRELDKMNAGQDHKLHEMSGFEVKKSFSVIPILPILQKSFPSPAYLFSEDNDDKPKRSKIDLYREKVNLYKAEIEQGTEPIFVRAMVKAIREHDEREKRGPVWQKIIERIQREERS